MKPITIFYILNATLLLLHEIESAYEKEWELLKLPGGITGFIVLHVPLVLAVLYGLLEIDKCTLAGLVLGIVFGIGGLIPFTVHKILVRKKDHFNLLVSNILIYLNILTGIGTVVLSVRQLI